jgi:hypothetical protein
MVFLRTHGRRCWMTDLQAELQADRVHWPRRVWRATNDEICGGGEVSQLRARLTALPLAAVQGLVAACISGGEQRTEWEWEWE